MSNWITLATADDLRAFLVAAQVSALQSAALGSGQADPFTEIMPAVAAEIRNAVASNITNRISATPNSVPPEFKAHFAYLVIEGMQARLPVLKILPSQRTLIDNARAALALAREGKMKATLPTDPLTPSDVQRGGAVESLTTATRSRSASQLIGL